MHGEDAPGAQQRTRQISVVPEHGGAGCPVLTQMRPCGNVPCGCSHVACEYKLHEVYNNHSIRVHHSIDELFGSKHTCKIVDGQCSCTCTDFNAEHFTLQFRGKHWDDDDWREYDDAATAPSPADVFISEYVEGSCNTKAIELHNPTDVDITMNGTHLQWHHSDDFYGHQRDDEDTDVNANGYDIRLDGKTIPAGGTFVFCREQRVTSATDCTSPAGDAVKFPLGTNEQRLKPNGPCDMVVGSSAGCVEPYCNPSSATGNAVKHTGDDSIELRLDGRPACFNASIWGSEFKALMESVPHYDTCGDAVDVVGFPGEDVDDMSAAERLARGAVDDDGSILFKDHTLRRKVSVAQGSPTFQKAQWNVLKHVQGSDGHTESGLVSISDLGALAPAMCAAG